MSRKEIQLETWNDNRVKIIRFFTKLLKTKNKLLNKKTREYIKSQTTELKYSEAEYNEQKNKIEKEKADSFLVEYLFYTCVSIYAMVAVLVIIHYFFEPLPFISTILLFYLGNVISSALMTIDIVYVMDMRKNNKKIKEINIAIDTIKSQLNI